MIPEPQKLPLNDFSFSDDIKLNTLSEMHPENQVSNAMNGSIKMEDVPCSKSVELNLCDLQQQSMRITRSNCKEMSSMHSSSHQYVDVTSRREMLVDIRSQSGSVETLEDTPSSRSNGRISLSKRDNKILADERDMIKELYCNDA